MPRKNGDVDILEFREQVQRTLIGAIGLTRDQEKRKAARKAVKQLIKDMRLTVRGQQNEVVDPIDVDVFIDQSLDEVEDITIDPPDLDEQ